jgi:UDP-3-O-[3-hydroxymyristoyl] glucosamine N-acyltransferase
VTGDGAQTGPSPLTAAALAAAVGGIVDGHEEQEITGAAALERAETTSVTFLAGARYAPAGEQTRAGVVLVTAALAAHVAHVPARVIVAKPQEAMLRALALLHRPTPLVPGIHPSTVIGRGAELGDAVQIGPGVVIGAGARIGARVRLAPHVVIGDSAHIGDDCVLHARVTVYAGTCLGQRVQVHAGTVLGSDGFGYVFQHGAHQKIPHVGRCVIGDDVEIGANCAIDRGSVDDTVIGAGAKIDNLVHIAHNVRIGSLALVMAQVGVAGSSHVGDGAILAGQAGISGHVRIGAGARIAAQAGVIGDVPAGETWSGYPARPHRDALRSSAAVQKLPELLRTLRRERES